MAKAPKIGCLVASAGFIGFILVLYFEFLSHHHLESKLGWFRGGLLAVILLLVGLIATDFTRRITSDYYSYKNIWIHYISLVFLNIFGKIFYNKLMDDTKNARKTQETLLMNFLNAGASTKYGQDHYFTSMSSVSDFQASHPLTTYSHYQPYIDRVASGEEGVMSTKSPIVLAMTSGTSGPNSSSPTNSKSELSFHSTPAAAFEITSEPEALYVYLLFGLRDKKLGYLEANFASLIYTAFVSLEKNWRQLVEDISNGSVSLDLDLDPDIRKKLNKQLNADPIRAAELQVQFERGFLGIASQIWPSLSLILCVDSGTFKVYGDLLRNYYCKGIPIYSPIYAATEGLIGLNIWPHCEDKNYLLLPRALFYEFIPIENSSEEQPKTLLLHQLENDQVYEMVVTNASGLFRYRFGDVVKVKGHHNTVPFIEFMYRQGQLLNVRGEKTSEKLLYECMSKAMMEICPDNQLVDYCCIEILANTDGSPPKYKIIVEMTGEANSKRKLASALSHQLDSCLMSSYIYKSFRLKGSIDEAEVHIVPEGSFRSFRILQLGEGATPNQFKVPRVLRKQTAIDFMMNLIEK